MHEKGERSCPQQSRVVHRPGHRRSKRAFQQQRKESRGIIICKLSAAFLVSVTNVLPLAQGSATNSASTSHFAKGGARSILHHHWSKVHVLSPHKVARSSWWKKWWSLRYFWRWVNGHHSGSSPTTGVGC